MVRLFRTCILNTAEYLGGGSVNGERTVGQRPAIADGPTVQCSQEDRSGNSEIGEKPRAGTGTKMRRVARRRTKYVSSEITVTRPTTK